VDRAQKRELVTALNGVFKDTGVIVVAKNAGLVAAQSADFRRRVKAAGGSVKVAKNRLAALALNGTDAEGIKGLLKGPTVLAFSKDPIAAAKAAGREPFKVRSLEDAEFGRKEIRLAEQEMPGLMALRAQHKAKQPLAGARIMGGK